MTTLWIDDDRPLPSFYDEAVTTVATATNWLSAAKSRGETVDVVSFDYDADHLHSLTFLPVAEWMRDNAYWPRELRIHTFNYWEGRPALMAFFAEHAPESTVVTDLDPWLYTAYLPEHVPLDVESAPAWVRSFIQEVEVQTKRPVRRQSQVVEPVDGEL